VYYVDLTLLNDPSQVLSTLTETLNLREAGAEPIHATLKRYLQDKQMLILLDNFEHLMGAAAEVGELITGDSRVDFLVTSREALRLTGEQTFYVPPLDLPEPGQDLTPESLRGYEAVELFVRRAQAANNRFELTPENAADVAEICRRLDGLPLAIELAAARSRLFTPRKLLERLSDRLQVLSGSVQDIPARQQTLRSTIDWSYNLLDEAERALFARLAVFTGGGNLEAVEFVCSHEPAPDVLNDLESLLDKSLIRQEEDFEGQPRFVMLETIQSYARELLFARPDWEATLVAHAEWSLDFAGQAEQGLFEEATDVLWTRRLQLEEGNIRAVFTRGESGQLNPAFGIRLAGMLRYYWETSGKLSEGRDWLESMLLLSKEESPAVLVKAICGVGVLAYWQGDWQTCKERCQEALAIAQELGDLFTLGEVRHFLGHVLQHEGDPEGGLLLLRASLNDFLELEHPWGIFRSRICLADAERLRQNYDQAAVNFEEIIDVYKNRARGVMYTAILNNYGHVLNRQGRVREALETFQTGIRTASEVENSMILGFLFDGLAGTSVLSNQARRAARLMGASKMAFDLAGVTAMNAIDQFDHDYYMDVIREDLETGDIKDLMNEGRSMTLGEAVAYSLETRVNL
ncbi:MAG: hypothetical protein R3335_14225, partial [Anaerolineales bacterium]|nr:hypothetical protein [Anaerolineales bacterium]